MCVPMLDDQLGTKLTEVRKSCPKIAFYFDLFDVM